MVIGVDIGGTNLRVAAIDDAGSVLAKRSTATRPELGAQHALERIAELTTVVAAEVRDEPAAIGVAVTGPVDPRTGIVDNPYTLAGWGPTDVATPLRARFAVDVAVENDANAAALGEWWRGAGRGVQRLAVVTIGTGIGVGLLIDGVIQRGPGNRHGEAGHQVLDPSGPRCYCGATGCWEALASGTALQRDARAAGMEHQDGAAIATAARHGDPTAITLLQRTGRWIGLGLVNIAAIFSPHAVVLGGSVATNLSQMLPAIEDVLSQHGTMIPTAMPVRAAQTGDDAGVLGAAFAARA